MAAYEEAGSSHGESSVSGCTCTTTAWQDDNHFQVRFFEMLKGDGVGLRAFERNLKTARFIRGQSDQRHTLSGKDLDECRPRWGRRALPWGW